MKILVTGCFGFIGYNFINSILKNNNGDFLLLGIDSLSSPYSRLNYKNLGESENFKFYEEDICNISDLDFSNKDQIDLVINFAAESHVDTSIYNPSLFIKSNILGVNNLLNFCVKSKINNFIQISTDEVYGDIVKGRTKESHLGVYFVLTHLTLLAFRQIHSGHTSFGILDNTRLKFLHQRLYGLHFCCQHANKHH